MWFLLGSVVSKLETMLLLFTSMQENLEDIFACKKQDLGTFLASTKTKTKIKTTTKTKTNLTVRYFLGLDTGILEE